MWLQESFVWTHSSCTSLRHTCILHRHDRHRNTLFSPGCYFAMMTHRHSHNTKSIIVAVNKNSLCNILIFSLYTVIVVTWLMITLHCLVLSIPERTLLSRQSKVWSQRHLFQWKLLEFFCSIYVYIYVCFILCMQWYHDHIVVFPNLMYYFFECNIIPIDGANDHVYKMNHNIW